jgi:hypothetical protein
MMHDDEQSISYERHLERINISYLLEYNFSPRYSSKAIEPLNNFNHLKMLLRKLLNFTFYPRGCI